MHPNIDPLSQQPISKLPSHSRAVRRTHNATYISGSLAQFTANRRASSRVNRLVAERCDAAICPDWARSGSARLAPGTTLMTSNPPPSVGSYLGPSLPSCFLISGLSYKTTFNSELRISSFPLYSI